MERAQMQNVVPLRPLSAAAPHAAAGFPEPPAVSWRHNVMVTVLLMAAIAGISYLMFLLKAMWM